MKTDEPTYTIALAFAAKPIAVTRGIHGLMETMPQLEPNIYNIWERGRIVANALRRSDGGWLVEFDNGMRLSPGCIVI